MKGYNVSAGGNTAPRTPEILQKISESLQKHYETHDGWNKGGNLTEEWKSKISVSHMGLPGTNTGKIFDNEWKSKISESNKGKRFSETHKENLSQSHKGKIAFNRKLSLEQVKEIRRLYNTTKISQKELGKQFGISQPTINDIVRNVTYKEV